MHQLLLLLLALAAACAAPPRIVSLATDRLATVGDVAADLAEADFVALGELHGVADVHRMHLRLLEAVHARRPDLVIAMEMFERDVQAVLDAYLAGNIDEAEFLANARPWKNYATDYRPVVEFARANGLAVLAANAPRELAREAANEGLEKVLGNPHVARETTAPEDPYWDAFVDLMQGHGGLEGLAQMRRFYAAQCLKDDTMAESIVDHLASCAAPKPLVFLICGRMHSDFGRGAVQRVRSRLPDLDIRVLSVELVDDVGAGYFSSIRSVADYVVVAQQPEPAEEAAPPAAKEPAPADEDAAASKSS